MPDEGSKSVEFSLADLTALSRLLDEAAIRDAIARFADTSMRGDFDGFRALWAQDGVWEIPKPFEARAQGLDAIVAMLHRLRDGRDFFVQFAVPGPIEVSGDEAVTRCIVSEAARGPKDTFYRNHGLFHDRLRRTDQGWVFSQRRFQYLWLDTSSFTGDAFPITK